MPYRSAMFDDQLEIPSAHKSTTISYARRQLKCICLLVLIAIIVTATVVGCSILVYEQVFRKSSKEGFAGIEETRVAGGAIRLSAVSMTDDVSATATFTTMSTTVTNSATTDGDTNAVTHVSVNGVPTEKLIPTISKPLNTCSRACCDTRQTKVYLGDLAPGINNGLPDIVTVLQNSTLNGNQECSKTALLKVRFDKFGGCPFCGRYLVRIDLELSRVARKGFIFNIGDSQSNNGHKGDSNHQMYDTEADGLGNDITVHSNDKCKEFRSVSFSNAIGPGVSHVSIYIGNEYIRVTNDAGMDQEMCSYCLYALNMQPDTTVNQDIFVALNRVVSGYPSRTGYGVCAATLSWDCGKY